MRPQKVKSCPSKNVKFEKDAKQDKEVAKDEVGASKKMVQVCASHLGIRGNYCEDTVHNATHAVGCSKEEVNETRR